MKREIKFRAWDNYKKVMRPPSDLRHQYVHFPKCFKPLQFTGLTDCKGKDVYEGDIVQGFERTGEYPGEGFYYKAEVVWSEEWGAFQAKEITGDERYLLYDYDFETVAGNIFENPELLER